VYMRVMCSEGMVLTRLGYNLQVNFSHPGDDVGLFSKTVVCFGLKQIM